MTYEQFPEPTRPIPTATDDQLPPTPVPPPPAPPGGRPPRRGMFAASVVAASVLLGGAAGLGGAAAWDATQSEDQPASTVATSASPVANQVPAAPEGSVEKVAAEVLPSVVKILVSGPEGSGSGSGIILSQDGLILTNNHVVELAAGGGGTLAVSFNDGSSASATVVGTDPLTDTAVIQAEDVSGLTPATIGTSADLRVGQEVVAIGSPFGLQSTVTSGIVSALNRPVNVGSDSQGNSTTYPAIQTDAAINPGNSGGPLVDMNGSVVGINSSIRTASNDTSGGQAGSIGLGFAIPMDEVMPIVQQMIDGDPVTHARLGVSVSDQASSGDSGLLVGAQVGQVSAGSAAEKAGLQAGDVITQVDATQITGSDSLVATIRAYRPGDQVKVTWTRDGETQSATVTLDSDAQAQDQ
ncbi:MAG TPA: trypsin-like peptidase domain-containing protein [Nocardioides sp.]|uniref:S1C family serine protease n=1 Tax=Nocardioides sp. TaxID=35761 RepID=UPI002C6CC1C6|nr:trypsin-like peptidase domain-containing protein [Nocardioides sp.]HQR26464.1 trypsin-like peptidase domain-containing protein [Nocardioides sp.]